MKIKNLTYDESIKPEAVGCSLRFNGETVILTFWQKQADDPEVKILQSERGEHVFKIVNTLNGRRDFIRRTRKRLAELGLDPTDSKKTGGNLFAFRFNPN